MRHEYIAGTQPGFPAPLTDGRDRAGVPGLRQAGNAERVEAPDPRSITIREFFNRNRGGTGRAGLGSSCWIEERGHLLRLHTPKGTELVSDHDDTTTVLETVRTTVDCPETDDGQKGLRAHELASIPFARSTAADVTGKIISRLTGAMLAFSGIAILVWVVWAGASIITGYFFESSAVRTDPAPSTSVAAMEVQSAQAGLVVPVFEARSIRCEWGRGTQADWDGGKLSLEQGTFGRDASLTFDSIDIEKRTARILGNAGASDVVVIPTPVGLTFFEQTALGGVNVTTVFASGVGANKQLVGVTSRHLSTFGGPFPSQWHGPCRIFN